VGIFILYIKEQKRILVIQTVCRPIYLLLKPNVTLQLMLYVVK